MKNIYIIFNLILFNFIYAECYELNQSDCLYWSEYCEWNEETNQCQDIGGDGGGGQGSTGGGEARGGGEGREGRLQRGGRI